MVEKLICVESFGNNDLNRSFMSRAEALEKVKAKICSGGTPPLTIRFANRMTVTVVFPLPGQLMTQVGPFNDSTASNCCRVRVMW